MRWLSGTTRHLNTKKGNRCCPKNTNKPNVLFRITKNYISMINLGEKKIKRTCSHHGYFVH